MKTLKKERKNKLTELNKSWLHKQYDKIRFKKSIIQDEIKPIRCEHDWILTSEARFDYKCSKCGKLE